MSWLLTLSLILLLVPLKANCRDQGLITIAVASNFVTPMREICEVFETEHPYKVQVSSGSSGKFFAQIKHGAPYDILFSADQKIPKALEQQGFAVAGSRFTYAVGLLTLWSSNRGAIKDPERALKSGDFRKLALANPKLAPYGAAAEQILNSLDLEDSSRSKWVFGENISQTFQFTHSGNADLGFVAFSQLQNGQKGGKTWAVPQKLYSPIKQDAVLLKNALEKPAVRHFLKFFTTEKARTIIRKYGYQTQQL